MSGQVVKSLTPRMIILVKRVQLIKLLISIGFATVRLFIGYGIRLHILIYWSVSDDHNDVVTVKIYDERTTEDRGTKQSIKTVRTKFNHSHKISNQTILSTLMHWLLIVSFANGKQNYRIPLLRHHATTASKEHTRGRVINKICLYLLVLKLRSQFAA